MNTVVQTILEQMGGANRITAMTGARLLYDENSVTIRTRFYNKERANTVTITYDYEFDTYRMKFFRIRGFKVVELGEVNDVYCDQIISLFESKTGLYLSL